MIGIVDEFDQVCRRTSDFTQATEVKQLFGDAFAAKRFLYDTVQIIGQGLCHLFVNGSLFVGQLRDFADA